MSSQINLRALLFYRPVEFQIAGAITNLWGRETNNSQMVTAVIPRWFVIHQGNIGRRIWETAHATGSKVHRQFGHVRPQRPSATAHNVA